MASRRSFIAKLTGRSNGDEPPAQGDRVQRGARTRDARLAVADAPAELGEPTRNGSGNGGGPPLRLPEAEAPRRRPRLKKLRIALVVLGLAVLALVSWVFGIMMAVTSDLPQLENRAQFAAAKNSVVLDRDGQKIATLTNNEGRILVPSEGIAPVMKEAVVAIEDQRFYEHRGVDFQGIGRAIYQDVLSGSAGQGASTITQQFVKNALAAQNDRTIFQKLREAALAYQLERHWDKDKIITEYLNSIYFGEGAYGIEAAAQTYFGWNHPGCAADAECASELLPPEAAMLAGLISSPSAYSPRASPQAALARRNLVLQRMSEQGYITEPEYLSYSDPKTNPIPSQNEIHPPAENSAAPYFTSWLRQQLVDRYGAGEAFGGGLRVHSTLDMDLQEQAQSIVSSRLSGLGIDSAVVALDNDTAEVRAMVGGPDFASRPFNLATQGYRQPGSSFKPFTLVSALEKGVSPDQVFPSQPKQFTFVNPESGKQEVFEVNNYDDSYLGSASLATATTYSDNSVYAEVGLKYAGGPEQIAKTAHAMGIDSSISTNPAMILGGLKKGVTPLEMAHAYETLAHNGQRVSGTLAASPGGPVAIDSVTDEDGNPVETNGGESGENKTETEQVVPADVAVTAKSILSTVVSTGTGHLAATGDDGIWGKTGTTDDNGDAWFVGSTPEITVAIWVGHADSVQPMTTEYAGGPVDGGTFPALIFHDIVLAWEDIKDAKASAKRSDESSTDGDTDSSGTYTPPATTTTPPVAPSTTEEPPTEETTPPTNEAAPPADQGTPTAPGGGGSSSGDSATGGGIVG
jgi:penicillin-binding protein 1A